MKIPEFSKKKNNAGRVTSKLSFILIRTATPRNIMSINPPDERIKILGNQNPTTSPMAPRIWNETVIAPYLDSPKRMNSCFICGETTYEMP